MMSVLILVHCTAPACPVYMELAEHMVLVADQPEGQVLPMAMVCFDPPLIVIVINPVALLMHNSIG